MLCTLLLVFCAAIAARAEERVLGVVVHQDGTPAAGARVWVAQAGRASVFTADGEGRFEARDVAPGYADVVAFEDGYALGGGPAFTVGGVAVRVTLGAPGTLAMRAVSDAFLPLPGTCVKRMQVNETCFVPVELLTPAGFPQLRADDAGVIDIPFLPAGGHAQLVLAHPDCADSFVAYLPVGDKRQDIIVRPGVAVRGRVTHDGAGVAGAEAVLFREAVQGLSQHADTLTDPEGYFSLPAAPGAYLLGVRHPEMASPEPIPIEARADEAAAPLDIALEAARFLEGSVLMPDGKPCGGAGLVFHAENGVYDEAYTGENGHFRVKASAPEGKLSVVPPQGYMTDLLFDIPVNMGDKMQTELDPIKLLRLPAISGKAVNESGEPAANALVRSLDFEAPVWTLTGADGAFSIQLAYVPDKPEATFRVEHPLRFLRADFQTDLRRTKPVKAVLKPFEPDQEKRPPTPGRNNLSMLIDKAAPEMRCEEWFNSPPLTLEELRGKVVAMTFWGGFDESIYGIARLEEMRALEMMFHDVDDVVFIGIHDASSEADEIEEYIVRFGLTFPVGRDDEPFFTFVNYNVNFIPQTVLIGKDGVLRYSEVDGRLHELVKVLRRK